MKPSTCLIALFGAATLFAQQAPRAPSFDVASIKASAPAVGRSMGRRTGGPGTDSPGQFTLSNYRLDYIIEEAFNAVYKWQMVIPQSATTNRYDIVAKVPAGATREQLYLMLQSLLVERFGLVTHREFREMDLYELVVAESGPRLTGVPNPAGGGERTKIVVKELPKDKDGWPILPGEAVGNFSASIPGYSRRMFRAAPISVLVQILPATLSKPVVDKTGLTGFYNYDLTLPVSERPASWSPPETPEAILAARESSGEFLRSYFNAVEKLGLKLISKKGPIEVIVVDKVNSSPTEN